MMVSLRYKRGLRAGTLPGVTGKVRVDTKEVLTQLIQVNVTVSTNY